MCCKARNGVTAVFTVVIDRSIDATKTKQQQ